MDSDENFIKHKKNIKKSNKKLIKKELQFDIDFYEYQKKIDYSIFDYKNTIFIIKR